MKGFTKKLITAGLATMIAGFSFGLAGCSIDERKLGDDRAQYIIKQNVYIVHYELDNGSMSGTLHKGNIIVDTGSYRYAGYGLTPALKLNCRPGRDLPTYLFNPYDEKPDASKYTHVCDECFDVIDKDQI